MLAGILEQVGAMTFAVMGVGFVFCVIYIVVQVYANKANIERVDHHVSDKASRISVDALLDRVRALEAKNV